MSQDAEIKRLIDSLVADIAAIKKTAGITLTPAVNIKNYVASLAASTAISTVINIDDLTPPNTGGTSIISQTIVTKPGEPVLLEASIPYGYISSSGNITLEIFVDGVCKGVATRKLTSGAGNGETVVAQAYVIATAETMNIDVRCASTVASRVVTLNSRWNGASQPYLTVLRFGTDDWTVTNAVGITKYAPPLTGILTSTALMTSTSADLLITDGVQIATTSFSVPVGTVIEVEVQIPSVWSDVAALFVGALFLNGAPLAAGSRRMAGGSANTDSVSFKTMYTATVENQTLELRGGPTSAAQVAFNDKWNGLSIPYLLIKKY